MHRHLFKVVFLLILSQLLLVIQCEDRVETVYGLEGYDVQLYCDPSNTRTRRGLVYRWDMPACSQNGTHFCGEVQKGRSLIIKHPSVSLSGVYKCEIYDGNNIETYHQLLVITRLPNITAKFFHEISITVPVSKCSKRSHIVMMTEIIQSFCPNGKDKCIFTFHDDVCILKESTYYAHAHMVPRLPVNHRFRQCFVLEDLFKSILQSMTSEYKRRKILFRKYLRRANLATDFETIIQFKGRIPEDSNDAEIRRIILHHIMDSLPDEIKIEGEALHKIHCNIGFQHIYPFPVCVPCQPGFFGTPDGPQCTECPMGTYQHSFAENKCNLCPVNQFSSKYRTYCTDKHSESNVKIVLKTNETDVAVNYTTPDITGVISTTPLAKSKNHHAHKSSAKLYIHKSGAKHYTKKSGAKPHIRISSTKLYTQRSGTKPHIHKTSAKLHIHKSGAKHKHRKSGAKHNHHQSGAKHNHHNSGAKHNHHKSGAKPDTHNSDDKHHSNKPSATTDIPETTSIATIEKYDFLPSAEDEVKQKEKVTTHVIPTTQYAKNRKYTLKSIGKPHIRKSSSKLHIHKSRANVQHNSPDIIVENYEFLPEDYFDMENKTTSVTTSTARQTRTKKQQRHNSIARSHRRKSSTRPHKHKLLARHRSYKLRVKPHKHKLNSKHNVHKSRLEPHKHKLSTKHNVNIQESTTISAIENYDFLPFDEDDLYLEEYYESLKNGSNELNNTQSLQRDTNTTNPPNTGKKASGREPNASNLHKIDVQNNIFQILKDEANELDTPSKTIGKMSSFNMVLNISIQAKNDSSSTPRSEIIGTALNTTTLAPAIATVRATSNNTLITNEDTVDSSTTATSEMSTMKTTNVPTMTTVIVTSKNTLSTNEVSVDSSVTSTPAMSTVKTTNVPSTITTKESMTNATVLSTKTTAKMPTMITTEVPLRLTTKVPDRTTREVSTTKTIELLTANTTKVPIRTTKKLPTTVVPTMPTTKVSMTDTTKVQISTTTKVPVRTTIMLQTTVVPALPTTMVPIENTTQVQSSNTTMVPIKTTKNLPTTVVPTMPTTKVSITDTTKVQISTTSNVPITNKTVSTMPTTNVAIANTTKVQIRTTTKVLTAVGPDLPTTNVPIANITNVSTKTTTNILTTNITTIPTTNVTTIPTTNITNIPTTNITKIPTKNTTKVSGTNKPMVSTITVTEVPMTNKTNLSSVNTTMWPTMTKTMTNTTTKPYMITSKVQISNTTKVTTTLTEVPHMTTSNTSSKFTAEGMTTTNASNTNKYNTTKVLTFSNTTEVSSNLAATTEANVKPQKTRVPSTTSTKTHISSKAEAIKLQPPPPESKNCPKCPYSRNLDAYKFGKIISYAIFAFLGMAVIIFVVLTGIKLYQQYKKYKSHYYPIRRQEFGSTEELDDE